MSSRPMRHLAKELLGRVPYAGAIYQGLLSSDRIPEGGFELDRLAGALPGWIEAAENRRGSQQTAGQRVLIVSSLKWWLEHAVALGLLLYSQGHRIELAYLPYRRWSEPLAKFDRQRQSAYLGRVLSVLDGTLSHYDITRIRPAAIPQRLAKSMEEQSHLDVQYTLQRELTDFETDPRAAQLYGLRRKRNRTAAGALLRLLGERSYDAVIIPNGSILELGAAFRTARSLGLPVVSYEFGEQKQRIWLAQDQEVMRLPTAELWAERGDRPLTDSERAEIEALYEARRGGRAWRVFARQWQKSESSGAVQVRRELGLDQRRPVVLLCTNVVGDSLALDRQIFTSGMADWLQETVRFIAGQPECQLVVRVHPGELLGAGHPSIEIVRGALPDLPPTIKLVPPESPINTYDLIELAHLGLTYTTTVGMEMAMFGVPVVVAGDTHYRGKGFTDDPQSLNTYRASIRNRLQEPLGRALPEQAIELAWRYAHRFFFEFPFDFPWHLITFWDDIGERPMEEVLLSSDFSYGRTLNALTGYPIEWSASAEVKPQEQLA